MRRGARAGAPVVELSGPLDAAEHRRRADGYAAEGRFAEAVRERMRAIVRELETRGVLEPRPGRTADEVAREAGAAVRAVAPDLRTAATVFDEVWYGGRTATAQADALLRQADQRVQRAQLVVAGASRTGGRRIPGAAVSVQDGPAEVVGQREPPADADRRRDGPPTEVPAGPRPVGPPEPAAEDPQTASGASVRTLWRRHRLIVFLLLGILLVATAVGIAQTRSAGGRLDPRSADEDGARALATLLDERGVRVQRVTEPAALTAATTDQTAVLVTVPRLLGDDGARALGEVSTGTVVLVSPAVDVLEIVTDDVRREDTTPVGVRDPGCTEPAAEAAGRALMGGTTFSTDDGATCYREDGDYAPLVTGRTRGGARLVVIGTAAPLTNGRLAEEGNAALGLNLLGADGSATELRWLVPSPGSGTGEDRSLSSILPGLGRPGRAPAAVRRVAARALAWTAARAAGHRAAAGGGPGRRGGRRPGPALPAGAGSRPRRRGAALRCAGTARTETGHRLPHRRRARPRGGGGRGGQPVGPARRGGVRRSVRTAAARRRRTRPAHRSARRDG